MSFKLVNGKLVELSRSEKAANKQAQKEAEQRLSQERAEECAAHAKLLLDSVVEKYSTGEQIVWPQFEQAANQLLAGGPYDKVLVETEALGSGLTEVEWAQMISGKASRLQKLRQRVTAARREISADNSVLPSCVATDTRWPSDNEGLT